MHPILWIIVAVIVIIFLVNRSKKKKAQSQQPTPAPTPTPFKDETGKTGAPLKAGDKLDSDAFARAFAVMNGDAPVQPPAPAPEPAPTKSETGKTGTPPKAGDKLDSDAFARAFAVMNGDAPVQPPPPASKPVPAPEPTPAPAPAPTKSETGKTGTPPKAGDKLDSSAFARAFAVMNGDAPAPAKPEEPSKPAARGDAAPAGPSPFDPSAEHKEFSADILGYYHNLWNRENGTLYTDLDKLPIDHFSIQIRADRLVESVWMQGDDIPLVSETEYTKLCGSHSIPDLSSEQAQNELLLLVAKYLVHLGTVTVKGNDFYPSRGGAPRPAAPEDPAPAEGPSGKAADAFSQANKDAQLRAQIQAMMEKQRGDKK